MRQLLWMVPVVVLGCAHKQAPETAMAPPTPPASAGVTQDQPPQTQPIAAQDRTCSNDLECGAKNLCIRARCVEISKDLAECQMFRVHFNMDDAMLKPEDQQGLQRVARCLQGDLSLHVVIEGNADERGSQDYNLALGDRRATAVARYLQSLGVSDDQLRTISYGKENPLCVEHDEACWSQNRRASVKPRDMARNKGNRPM